MKLLLGIVIIIIISLLGSRVTFFNRRLSLGFRNILFTGFEYIFIGALLGSMGLGVLDADALAQMEPFLVFGLSWIGFLFGLQFDVRQLKNLANHYFTMSAVQAFITFVLVGVSMYFLFGKYLQLPAMLVLMIAVTLGSTASCSAQSALAIVSKNYKFGNRRLLDLMRYISAIDGFYALLFFAIAQSFFPGADIAGFDLINSLIWLVISGAMGVMPALILISLSRVRFSEQEFLVFLIGAVMLCGGIAQEIRYSPLISGLIFGVVTANFSRHSLRALSLVMNAEKTLYIILLLLLGASWNFSFKLDYIILITVIYLLARFVGKFIGAYAATKIFKPDHDVPASLGLGLISDGGLTVAIIIDVKLLYPTIADPLVTIIILSVFINELLSPWLILGRFKKEERYPVVGRNSAAINIKKWFKKKPATETGEK